MREGLPGRTVRESADERTPGAASDDESDVVTHPVRPPCRAPPPQRQLPTSTTVTSIPPSKARGDPQADNPATRNDRAVGRSRSTINASSAWPPPFRATLDSIGAAYQISVTADITFLMEGLKFRSLAHLHTLRSPRIGDEGADLVDQRAGEGPASDRRAERRARSCRRLPERAGRTRRQSGSSTSPPGRGGSLGDPKGGEDFSAEHLLALAADDHVDAIDVEMDGAPARRPARRPRLRPAGGR